MRLSPRGARKRAHGRQPTRPAAKLDGQPNGRSNPIRLMYLTVATTAAVFAFWAPTASAWQPGERAAQRHCEHGHVLSCIHRAAIHRHVSYTWLRSTAYCESRFNPGARNGQYVGLFQFGANAWSRSHYSQHSPWSAKWASLGAAYLFSIGHSSEWQCA